MGEYLNLNLSGNAAKLAKKIHQQRRIDDPQYSYSDLFYEMLKNMEDPVDTMNRDIDTLCTDILAFEGMSSDKTDFLKSYLRPVIRRLTLSDDKEFESFKAELFKTLEK